MQCEDVDQCNKGVRCSSWVVFCDDSYLYMAHGCQGEMSVLVLKLCTCFVFRVKISATFSFRPGYNSSYCYNKTALE